MKVIIPVVTEEKSKSKIVGEFRYAQDACIFDPDANSMEMVPLKSLIKNQANLTLELKSRGIYTVISNYMPFLSLRLFAESNFEVYKAQDESVETTIDMFKNGKLPPYSHLPGFGMSACSTSCSSCSSDCN